MPRLRRESKHDRTACRVWLGVGLPSLCGSTIPRDPQAAEGVHHGRVSGAGAGLADSIPPLQDEVEELLSSNELAQNYSAILEYELPMESRRPDAMLLVGGGCSSSS